MNYDLLRRLGALPPTPKEFATQELIDQWDPVAALARLRELNQPGITGERLEKIQDLRAMFYDKLNARN